MTATPSDSATGARRPPFSGAHAAAGVEAMLRAALIRSARDYSSIQDQIDCAELALAAGERDIARLLYDLVFLRLGFSAARVAEQRTLARETGLWREKDLTGAAAGPRPAFSVDAALAELKTLQAIPLPPMSTEEADIAPPGEPRLSPPTTAEETAEACARLSALLRRSKPGPELAALLDRLDERFGGAARPLLDRLDAPLAELAALFAFGNLRDFLLSHRELGFAPFGAPALLHAAARLDPAALGAYFGNVRNLVRTSRDVLALIRLASEGDAPPFERWSVLLAAGLPERLRLDLIDELADDGLVRPIRALLAVTARRAVERDERTTLWRIRDAGLDCGDPVLAITAQRLVAEQSPANRVEWSILGEIHASMGNEAEAEAMFRRCLQIDPDDRGVADRLAALRHGRFERYAVTGGFGTSRSRQRLRRASRGLSPRAA